MMQGQHKIDITEQKPAKFIVLTDGYEVLSNDNGIKIILRPITIMDSSMESGFYSSQMWINEDGGWLSVSNTKNYTTKEEFIKDIEGSEDFTQAMREYEEQNKVK